MKISEEGLVTFALDFLGYQFVTDGWQRKREPLTQVVKNADDKLLLRPVLFYLTAETIDGRGDPSLHFG